ncbi:MAG TPA: type II toxin-antitoxin system RelE/ParE family toxin [Sideroxyarcus sp.]|nr:type II toxin-antitoxin system RelE/ParE family toxin [Sideroxyarcus sp.]
MTYRLEFKTSAQKEWQKLDSQIREQFKKKLVERLAQPRIESARLTAMPDCYKIKLRAAGYRLVYQVKDATVTVIVVAVGKREDSAVYLAASKRIK